LPARQEQLMNVIRPGVFGFALLLAGCVNLSRTTEFSASRYGDHLTVDVYVQRVGAHLNIHGGNSDSYGFVIPSGQSFVPAANVIQYSVNHKIVPERLSNRGSIEIDLDPHVCRLKIELFSVDGKPLVVNGIHETGHCEQRSF
jgi:hypothetical protein